MSALTPGITVLIPTYKRTAELDRCLAAIDGQLLKPVEVWITYRPEDEETSTYLARTYRPGLEAKLIPCDKPGVVYALTKAFDAVRTEFFAITDDDSVPYPDWLARIMTHFDANPEVAGVGGKDHVCAGGEWFEGAEPVVGRVLWYGGVIGHHHLGVGPPRYVEALKGVNLAFRRSAIADLRPDPRLRGLGAQVGWEMHLTLNLIAQGHKLIYDPAVLVDHFPGKRSEEEDRARFNPVSHRDEVFNRTMILLEFLGTRHWGRLRQAAMLTYLGLRGSRKAPGLVLLAYGLLTGYPDTWTRFKTTFAAYRDAIAMVRKTAAARRG
jgi:Glycosyltransferase like family 2